MDELKQRWSALKGAHKSALIIFALVVVWVASGVLSFEAEDAVAAKAVGPTRVQVADLAAVDHQGELRLLGFTAAARSAEIKADLDAVVEARLVAKGALVEQGAAIARLAMDDRQARLKQAEAGLAQMQIAYDAAKQLSADGYRSKLKLAEAKAGLESARAALVRARLDVDNTTVRAPFAGVVDTIFLDVGERTGKEGVVARVLDLSTLVVVVEVAETEVSRLALGEAARVTLKGGIDLEGTLKHIERTADRVTRTFHVEVHVPNPELKFAQGLTAEVHLPMETTKAHRLSPAVLTLSEDGRVGIKAVEDGVVVFHPARMVGDGPDGIWLADLPARLAVIVVGQEFVRAGQRVEAVPVSVGD